MSACATGCNVVGGQAGYAKGYPAMGHALQASGREIVYSCSWPAYCGSNETSKPFQAMIDGGCNLWRNWHDIGPCKVRREREGNPL